MGKTTSPLCQKCRGKCCKTITIALEEKPRDDDGRIDWAVVDRFRYLVLHEGISLHLGDEGVWEIVASTPCVHLTAGGLCDDYENRPDICRDFDPENCAYVGEGYGRRKFDTEQELLAYFAIYPAESIFI